MGHTIRGKGSCLDNVNGTDAGSVAKAEEAAGSMRMELDYRDLFDRVALAGEHYSFGGAVFPQEATSAWA
jgi:hypothetical protein